MIQYEMKSRGGTLTIEGKQMVAESMYAKGKNFLGAALLLRQKKGYEYVVLHLLCQGIEIILKGVLLTKDYNKYIGRLKKNKKDPSTFGHDLMKLALACINEFNLRPLCPNLVAELEGLNTLYSRHRLRYGTFFDILVNPDTIESKYAMRKTIAVIRLANRYMYPEP